MKHDYYKVHFLIQFTKKSDAYTIEQSESDYYDYE